MSNDWPERTTEENAAAAKSTALVTLVQATQWSQTSKPQPRPNSIFVTQLIATAETGPEPPSPLRATAFDALNAYRTTQYSLAGAGMRARQTV